jgi:hypothetical protein
MLDETLNKKSLDIPQWLFDSIVDYQKKNGIKSFAAALLTLTAVGMNEVTKDEPADFGYFGGNETTDTELVHELEIMEIKEGHRLDWEEFFRKKFSSAWGGNRKSAE